MDEEEAYAEGEEGGEEDFVELDLDKSLTWCGQAVTVSAGSQFRLPLLVPQPSVLAIQFEVDGGYEIEFSLTFKDDAESESSLLVEPVRVSDREGQLDIDTTGVCEIVWSNAHAWMSAKTLSYQLQLAPKVDNRRRKWCLALVTAATDFRMLCAVEAAEKIDEGLRSLKQRTAQLHETVTGARERTAESQLRYERYQQHVRRLEEEVTAAREHLAQAAEELTAAHQAATVAERSLTALQQVRELEDGLTAAVDGMLTRCEAPLELLYHAYAGSLYAPQEEEDEVDDESKPTRIDRAEMLHLLQDFGLLGRGSPPEAFSGVFTGCQMQLSTPEFMRALARAALRAGRRDEASTRFRAAADAAMDGGLYALVWVIGRECTDQCAGNEGRKIIDAACAEIGKPHDELEREYLAVLQAQPQGRDLGGGFVEGVGIFVLGWITGR